LKTSPLINNTAVTNLNSHGVNRHSRAIIDLDALRHNYLYLKELSAGNRVIAVVKADAYGHGATEVAKALPDADAFAVAAVGEAVSLRKAGINQKILVMGGFIRADELQTCIDLKLDPVLHHQTHLQALQEATDLAKMDVWVKVDSGMGRLGFLPSVVPDIIKQLNDFDTLGNIRLMSHLANADDSTCDFTHTQIDRIKSMNLDEYEWGIANSAGILGWPDAHRLWVRSGIALYGADPMSDRADQKRNLKPVMTMKSSVLAVNMHSKGDFIGYANTYCCPQDMTIAVIATGYADGYPRHKIGTAQALVKGQLCDIVGRVSMDMITLDVSHVDNVQVDDDVTFFGASPDVCDVADCAQTIAYEVLCNVGAHVKREYIRT
jgi:alanine racemase